MGIWLVPLFRSLSAPRRFSVSSPNLAHRGAGRFVDFRCGGFPTASCTTSAKGVFAYLRLLIRAANRGFGVAAHSAFSSRPSGPNKSLQPTVIPLRGLPAAELRRYGVMISLEVQPTYPSPVGGRRLKGVPLPVRRRREATEGFGRSVESKR